MSPHQGSLFYFRENYMGYYEKQGARLTLFLFVFFTFQKGEDHNG